MAYVTKFNALWTDSGDLLSLLSFAFVSKYFVHASRWRIFFKTDPSILNLHCVNLDAPSDPPK